MATSRSRPSSSTTGLILLAVAGGVGIGVALTMALAHSSQDPGPGDWLNAGGVLIGIVASIATAVWIEDRKRLADRRADMQMLIDALAAVAAAAKRQAEAIPDSYSLAGVRIITDYEALVEAIETLDFIRELIRPYDVLLWRRLREVDRQWRQIRVALGDCVSTAERGALNERQLADDRDALRKFAAWALPHIETSIQLAARLA